MPEPARPENGKKSKAKPSQSQLLHELMRGPLLTDVYLQLDFPKLERYIETEKRYSKWLYTGLPKSRRDGVSSHVDALISILMFGTSEADQPSIVSRLIHRRGKKEADPLWRITLLKAGLECIDACILDIMREKGWAVTWCNAVSNMFRGIRKIPNERLKRELVELLPRREFDSDTREVISGDPSVWVINPLLHSLITRASMAQQGPPKDARRQ